MRGRLARFAYSAPDLVAFLDSHTTYTFDGTPRRKRRLTNGVVLDQDTDVRIIRRWRSGSVEGVTKAAAARMLGKVGLTLAEFHAQYPNAIIRNRSTAKP